MEKAEPPSHPPADFRRRALARVLDLVVAAAPLFLAPRAHPRAGPLLAAALILFGDSLFGAGRSLGKRLSGLRVLTLATRRPAGVRESVLRNALFALAAVPAAIGAPPLISLLSLGCIVLIETGVALRPLTRDFGQRRIGDLLAGTQVVDARLALGLPAAAVKSARAPAPLASRAALEKEAKCVSP